MGFQGSPMFLFFFLFFLVFFLFSLSLSFSVFFSLFFFLSLKTFIILFLCLGTEASCSDSSIKTASKRRAKSIGRPWLHFPAIQDSQTAGLPSAVIQTICCCLRPLPPRSLLSRPNPSATDAVDAAGKQTGRVAPWRRQTELGV